MNEQTSKRRSPSRRKREHMELLERAFARPGVREVMNIYDNWREKDRGLNSYRAATKNPGRITTTNSSNSP